VGAGLQQALDYADTLDVPFAFSSNGDAFLFHERTGQSQPVEAELPLDAFPSPEDLWQRYCAWKGLTPPQATVAAQDYHLDAPDKQPRYYQESRSIAPSKPSPRDRIASCSSWRRAPARPTSPSRRSGVSGSRREETHPVPRGPQHPRGPGRVNDFKPFAGKMTKSAAQDRQVLRNLPRPLPAVSGTEDIRNIYKQFSPDFFDLVIVDECHRGSAAEDSAWREILTYFSGATQIASPPRLGRQKTSPTSSISATPSTPTPSSRASPTASSRPTKSSAWTSTRTSTAGAPGRSTRQYGQEIPDRLYNQLDMDRELVLDERTKTVAWRITQYLKATDRFAKTIVFCEDIDHAERMRQALIMWNGPKW